MGSYRCDGWAETLSLDCIFMLHTRHLPYLFGCFWAWFAAIAVAETQLPNILWLTAEDMSCELGCYGDEYADTPRIDRLAKQGIRYTRFFAESPMCSPSRSTIISGMHSGPLGTTQMRSNHRVPEFVRGFPTYLRKAGYYCVNNRKTDYNLADEQSFVDRTWDESSSQAHWRNRPEGKPFFCVLNYTDTHQSRTSRNAYQWFQERVQSRLQPDEIHDPDQAPLPPHYPETDIARRTVARYYDCISTLDDFVAKTLADLESDGLADETIVFFYSDHGAGMPTGKAAPLYYGVHVPLIVHVPEKYQHLAPEPPGSVSDRLACFADLAPTTLHLAGLSIPGHMHGQPFLGKDLPEPRPYVLGSRDRMDETLETTRWINDGRYHLVRSYRIDVPPDQQTVSSHYNGNGTLCQQIRELKTAGRLSETQRHFWADTRPAVMLFDCQEDPWNLNNLADQPEHQDRVDRMVADLEVFLHDNRDLGFWPEPDLAEAEQTAPAYELARSTDRYPLEQILATASLAGGGPENRSTLVARLRDDQPIVRYWAVVGLAGLGDDARDALPRVIAAMQDSVPSVRIEAAWLVAELTKSEEATAILANELDHPNQWVACRAARALELLGEAAHPHQETMQRVLQERGDQANYGLRFSLQTALEKLGAGE